MNESETRAEYIDRALQPLDGVLSREAGYAARIHSIRWDRFRAPAKALKPPELAWGG